MSIELKIKAKSLAAEAQMIRKEEIKLKKQTRWNTLKKNAGKAESLHYTRQSLYDHRINVVRWECRATNLARAFIKGHAYTDIESKSNLGPSDTIRLIKRVDTLLKKYHKGYEAGSVEAWFSA